MLKKQYFKEVNKKRAKAHYPLTLLKTNVKTKPIKQ